MPKTNVLKPSVDMKLELNQSISRYNIMMIQLGSKEEHELTVDQLAILESLKDSKDVVDDIENGKPVWDLMARAFVDDISQNWASFTQAKL